MRCARPLRVHDPALIATPLPQVRELQQIGIRLSDEKIALAVQTYDLVGCAAAAVSKAGSSHAPRRQIDGVVQRLDQDLKQFEAELRQHRAWCMLPMHRLRLRPEQALPSSQVCLTSRSWVPARLQRTRVQSGA